MRDECQALIVELQMLLDTKQVCINNCNEEQKIQIVYYLLRVGIEIVMSYIINLNFQTLDAEIAIYRKMLEGEGDGPGLKQLVEQVVKTTGLSEAADTGKVKRNRKIYKHVFKSLSVF